MRNLMKMGIIVFLAALILCTACNSYCDDSGRELKTFRGSVMEIDWVGSLLTVEGMDEITFYVPPGTRIINGVEKVSLSDIEQNENVLIKYYDDPSGTPKAASISIETSYPSF